ncbi:MAG: phage holin family protein [Chloroflexota bacterium]|nr:phage holin family protein [Chloroflexota bacterium]
MSGYQPSNLFGGANQVQQLASLARDGSRLLRQELALARQETIEKLPPAARSLAMIAGGGVIAVYGSAYLLQTIVRLLSTRMPPWLASLLTGGALTLGGIVLAGRGSRQLSELNIIPQKTINSLREDKEWLLHQIRSRLI